MSALRRQSGMGVNPLSDLELEAFDRRTCAELSAWEKDLIMRLDDAVIAAVRGDAPTAPAKKPDGEPADPIEVTPDNPQGVAAMFRGIAARKAKAPSTA